VVSFQSNQQAGWSRGTSYGKISSLCLLETLQKGEEALKEKTQE
jgi:hypothetical protein